MNDTLFISQLKCGDSAAYERLVKQFGNQVLNTAAGILQHQEDAEDITQEVFAEVFQSVKSFKGESKLSTWIYRITVTKSLEFLRKKRRKKRFSLFPLISINDHVEPITELPDFIHPGIQLENKERAAILFAAIDKLPPNQKSAFILQKLEELSYSEISEVLNLSQASVESLLFRARQNLQKLLGDYYDKNET